MRKELPNWFMAPDLPSRIYMTIFGKPIDYAGEVSVNKISFAYKLDISFCLWKSTTLTQIEGWKIQFQFPISAVPKKREIATCVFSACHCIERISEAKKSLNSRLAERCFGAVKNGRMFKYENYIWCRETGKYTAAWDGIKW